MKWIWSGLIIIQSHLVVLGVDLDSRPGEQQLYEGVVPPHLVGNKARFKDVSIFNFQPTRWRSVRWMRQNSPRISVVGNKARFKDVTIFNFQPTRWRSVRWIRQNSPRISVVGNKARFKEMIIFIFR